MAVRISADQARLLFGEAPAKTVASAVSARSGKPRAQLPENTVTDPIVGFLRARGWVVTRQQSGLFARPFDPESRVRIGSKGLCDWKAERLLNRSTDRTVSVVQQFEVEFKAPGKSPSKAQVAYMSSRNRTGFTAVWFDSWNSFRDWYRNRFPDELA